MSATLHTASKPAPAAGANDGLEDLSGRRLARGLTGALADCSLVIPTYSREFELRELLDTLVEQGKQPGRVPGEVVVVDGSPHHRVEDALLGYRESQLPFELLYVRSKPGLTRQRNVGIDVSSGDIVFFLDDDARPLDSYFRVIRDAFEADEERRIGAIGGFLENYCQGGPRANLRWRLRLALGIVPRVGPMQYSHCGSSNPISLTKPFSGLRRVDVLPGCAFAFRREVLNQERFSSFFNGYSQGEDLEMSLRVGRRWEVACAGDARALHLVATGARPTSFRKGEMETFNRLFIWKRHSAQHAGPLDVLRLGADITYIIGCDLCYSVCRPGRLGHLAHAAGCAVGLVRGVTRAVERNEPSARREYLASFQLVEATAPRE